MRKSSGFGADVNFDDVIGASGIEIDKKGLYPAKPFRNCESMAAVFGAFRMALAAKDREIQLLSGSCKDMAVDASKESGKIARMAMDQNATYKDVISARLEAAEIPEQTRERILSVG